MATLSQRLLSAPLRRVLSHALGSAAQYLETRIGRTPDGTRCFFEASDFPWTATLERNWRIIRTELDQLLAHLDAIPPFRQIQPEQGDLNADDRWKVFLFMAYGRPWPANCARCPQTVRLLRQIPGLTTALFSILGPRTRLLPHRGPYKGVLRYHLGLRVPEEAKCGLRVGEELRRWREGQSLVFDDSHIHEAWNDGDEPRVVLFVDFLRPLPLPLSLANRAFVRLAGHSPFIRRALKNLARWEEFAGGQFANASPNRR